MTAEQRKRWRDRILAAVAILGIIVFLYSIALALVNPILWKRGENERAKRVGAIAVIDQKLPVRLLTGKWTLVVWDEPVTEDKWMWLQPRRHYWLFPPKGTRKAGAKQGSPPKKLPPAISFGR